MDLIIFILTQVINYTIGGIIALVMVIIIIENWPDNRFNGLKRSLHRFIKE